MKNIEKSFTLAETLITLVIIGVVAALTIPTLMTKYQDHQYKQKFKVVYSQLAQADKIIAVKYGQGWVFPDDYLNMPQYYCRLKEQMKTVGSGIICPANLDNEIKLGEVPTDSKYIFVGNSPTYKIKRKTGENVPFNAAYQNMLFQLANGAMVNYACSGTFYVDVNGYEKPNTLGRDVYFIRLEENGFDYFANSPIVANPCADASVTFTKDNYREDCKNGSGWGCSVEAILN